MSEPLLTGCPHIFERFTIRGQCAECDYSLHRDYEKEMATYVSAAAEFKSVTGVDPLSNWDAFERWNTKKGTDDGAKIA